MPKYKGISKGSEINSAQIKKDTRNLFQKYRDARTDPFSLMYICLFIPLVLLAISFLPFSGEIGFFLFFMFIKKYLSFESFAFDFPYRVPANAGVLDGSTKGGKKKGEGVTLIGTDLEYHEQIYASDSDLRTHILVLGTTGSGKTEFLLGLVFNALAQNTGFIYVDGKGDPKLQSQIFRLQRIVGREADGLIVNFIMSGRDLVDKQVDKITNNMNIMGNTSSGMLIELIVSLMDDSGGGGDMWKGRAISFVAAITRPLVYLRDKGFINLSPDVYLNYFELHILEELVFDHNGKYGDNFDFIVAPLKSYLKTLPGYQDKNRKKQETKTLEQHGFIIMQLTRIFNDLTFNYGHILKTKIGDVDFFDVVVNRRCLVVLLPALERAPDSMKMLGKMIVGSIKQMMAGCLGNKVEGVLREIIDSRPTNAAFPFYTILDEYGYYAVVGFAVAPAQARSIGFSICFAAQDFSSLKKSSAEEADATWENTNIRAIGKLTSGEKSETWERVTGAASSATQAELTGYDREIGAVGERFYNPVSVNFSSKQRLHYDDFACQENGEFTFIIGKKENKGTSGGVRVIRGMGFYTATKTPKEMRINDFVPVEPPEPHELPETNLQLSALIEMIDRNQLTSNLDKFYDISPVLNQFSDIIKFNDYLQSYNRSSCLSQRDLACALIGYYCKIDEGIKPFKFKLPEIVSTDNNSSEIKVHDPSTTIDDESDLTLTLSSHIENIQNDDMSEAEKSFNVLADNSITNELLVLAKQDLLTDTPVLIDTDEQPHGLNKFFTDEEHTESENFSTSEPILKPNDGYERYLSRFTRSDIEAFDKHIKVYFDFNREFEKNSSSTFDSSLNGTKGLNRPIMSAMYHAQLMSLFSRGEKPTAKQIREIRDDVENEYQKLLNSTSYLRGAEPGKIDALVIKQTISLLGAECGSFLVKNLQS
jgi:intracellular multiplication protein IcmO